MCGSSRDPVSSSTTLSESNLKWSFRFGTTSTAGGRGRECSVVSVLPISFFFSKENSSKRTGVFASLSFDIWNS